VFTKTKPYKRTDRVGDQLRVIVSEILSQKIHHWGIEGMTVTRMDVSPDMRHAKAYYRVLDPKKVEEIGKNLRKVLPAIQKAVGKQMQTKYTPRVIFVYDAGIDHQDRIFELLNDVRPDDFDPESE